MLGKPTGLTLSGGSGISGGTGAGFFINNPQYPGFALTASTTLQGHGPLLPSGGGTFNLATVSGQATISGASASITCGVTGAATFSLTLSTPGGPLVLNCPNVAAPGVTVTVSGQIAFSPLSSLAMTLTLSGTASSDTDTLSLDTFSAQAQIPASATRFVPVNPCRILDTRNPNGPFGGPAIAGGASRDFVIPNSTCGIPSTAAGYSMNVAVVPHGKLGYLTLWPSGQTQPLVATLNSVDGRIKSNAAIVPAGGSGAVSVFATDTTDVVLDINGYFVPGSNAAALAFYPLTPCRIADTRNSAGPLGGPSLAARGTRSFPILASSCGLPVTAQAYSLNFAAVPKGPQLGFLTAWPAGQAQPLVASLNDTTGTIAANAVVVPAGTNGDVSVFTTDATDLVIDVNGYFAPQGPGGLSLYTMTPCRVLDSRLPAGTPPFSTTRDTNVTASPCGVPDTARAFVFNATVVPPGPLGYITMWPQGQSRPLAATLNAIDGAITNNMAIVPATNGSISVFPLAPTHLVLDIFGFFAP
ncbi:MAG: hypothetical protein LAO55_25640 [Acidobacteriia bacterium]|nr:hypothetical protein [Terriglobia bacterium]